MAEELREPDGRTGPHYGMDEELHAMVCPHPPFELPNMRNDHHFEIYPIGIDPIIHTIVWFDPVPVNISWIGLVGAEASIKKNLLDPSGPESVIVKPSAASDRQHSAQARGRCPSFVKPRDD